MKPKFKKTFNINLIKQDYSYSVNEIAEFFDITKQTVCLWQKEGLKSNDNKKPYLFYGRILREFIKNRQEKRKTKHKEENQTRCCKCKKSVKNWENVVDVVILNEKILNITGLCEVCGTKTNKFGAVKNLEKIQNIFNVQVIHNKHLIGFADSSGIINFKENKKK